MINKFRCNCPFTSALDVLGDKWMLVIVKQMLIEGSENGQEPNNTTWRTNITPAQNLPLPSPYTELETPSDGTHMFYIGSSLQSPPDPSKGESVLFNLSYKCQEGNNTVPTTGNITIDLSSDTFDVGIFGVRGVFVTLGVGE